MLLRPSGDLAEIQILIQQVWAGGLTLWPPAGSWQRWSVQGSEAAESARLYLHSAAPAHPRSWYRKQVHHEIDEGGKGRRAQPLKERPSPWRHDEGWLEPARSKTAEGPTSSSPRPSLYAQWNTPAAKGHTHQRHDASDGNRKRPKSGRWPNSWKSPLLPPK